jgi:3-dehydroquinate synthetase
LLNPTDRQRILSLLQKANLPISHSNIDANAVFHAMFSDKKVRDGKLRFVLPDGIGRATSLIPCQMSWCGRPSHPSYKVSCDARLFCSCD